MLNWSAGTPRELSRSENARSRLVTQVGLSKKKEDIRRNFREGLRQEQIPEKICQRAATITMLRLKINHMSNKHESTLKVYGAAGGQKQTRNRPGRWQRRASGGDLEAVSLAAS